MLRNCNRGYILLEMLIALNILLLICIFIIPNFTLIKGERNNIQQVYRAQDLLSEELEYVFFAEKEMETRSFYEENTTYTISWEYKETFGLYEGCILWEDYFKRPKKRCGYSKGK